MKTRTPDQIVQDRKTYFKMKEKYSEHILIVANDDFYEAYGDDAERLSQATGLTVIKSALVADNALPICGFRITSLDWVLPKVIMAGYKVALCDKMVN